MKAPRELVWATLFGAGVLYEVHELRAGGIPLSKLVRRVARTDTRSGRLVFLAGWGGFAAWFALHIIEAPVARPRRPVT